MHVDIWSTNFVRDQTFFCWYRKKWWISAGVKSYLVLWCLVGFLKDSVFFLIFGNMKIYNIIGDLGRILISNGYIGLKYYCIGIKGHSVHFAIFFFVEFSTATFCVVSGNKNWLKSGRMDWLKNNCTAVLGHNYKLFGWSTDMAESN